MTPTRPLFAVLLLLLGLGLVASACPGNGRPDDDDGSDDDDDGAGDDDTAPDDDDFVPDDPPISDEFAQALEDQLQATFAAQDAPGMVLAVQAHGRAIWSTSIGVSHRDDGTDMQPDDRFKAGEITKGMIAARLLQLEDVDEIPLWEVASLWYPPGLPETWFMTTNQLLANTGGAPDYRDHDDFDVDATWEPGQLVTMATELPVVHNPGSEWTDSATHFVLGSLIIEGLVGTTWQADLQSEFIDALSLTDTYIPAGSNGWGDVVPGYTGSADVSGDDHPSAFGGSGALVSTAPDLARWGQALYSGDVLGDSLGQMVGDPWSLVPQYRYGLATLVYQQHEGGPQLWGHAGNLPGHAVWMGYRQEFDTSMVLFANDDQVDPLIASLDFWPIIEQHVGMIDPGDDDDDDDAVALEEPHGQHRLWVFKRQLPHVGSAADPDHDGVQLSGWWDFDNDGETVGHFTVMSADFSSGSPTGGVSCDVVANGTYNPGDQTNGITGSLHLESWNFNTCPGWSDAGAWQGYLESQVPWLYLVPIDQVTTGWQASWPGAEDDLGGTTVLIDFINSWMGGTGAGLGAVGTPMVILADSSDLVTGEGEVPPWGYLGFTWQTTGDQ